MRDLIARRQRDTRRPIESYEHRDKTRVNNPPAGLVTPETDADAGEYQDAPGFCKSATLEEIRKHGYVLTPGRYVGASPQEDDGEPFAHLEDLGLADKVRLDVG